MSEIGFLVVFYLLPLLIAGAVTWAERQRGAPPLAGAVFAVLPVINLVCAGGWVLLRICQPVDRRVRSGLGRAA